MELQSLTAAAACQRWRRLPAYANLRKWERGEVEALGVDGPLEGPGEAASAAAASAAAAANLDGVAELLDEEVEEEEKGEEAEERPQLIRRLVLPWKWLLLHVDGRETQF